MKRILIALSALFFTSVFVVDEAEARRLGGGRSAGTQRQALPDKPATPPAAQQAAPAGTAAAAGAKKPMSPWMGALAGLAAGLGLAWLLGDNLGSVMMAVLLGLAAVVVVSLIARAFMKPRAQAAPGGLQYAGLGNETVAAPPPSQAAGGVAVPSFQSQFTPKVPANFNADAFLREAKKSFLALQVANDRGDIASIRELVTDEMYKHLKQDVDERRGAGQRTDVVSWMRACSSSSPRAACTGRASGSPGSSARKRARRRSSSRRSGACRSPRPAMPAGCSRGFSR